MRENLYNDLQESYVDMQFTYVNLEGLWYHNQVYGTLRRKVLARIQGRSQGEGGGATGACAPPPF